MDINEIMAPDTDPGLAREALEAKGFKDASRALANLRLMAEGVENPLLMAILPSLVEACSLSADPDACLNNFERLSMASVSREEFLSAISWAPGSVTVLAPILASSRFLTIFLSGDPEGLLSWLLAPGRLDGPRERDEIRRELVSLCPPETTVEQAMETLRFYKYREFLRITARDLLGRADVAETTLELSNLADAALDAAIGVAARELDGRYGPPRYTLPWGGEGRCPFTVIAMGKLGGQELNFSSDIDIMYVYLTGEGETTGARKVSNHQYFVKMGELVTRLIGEKTQGGFVFRVDLRLRPEGERGEIAMSLDAYELYYESWGQTWERSALIKARPCAGSEELGRGFTDMVRPFVYRKYIDFAAIGEISEMKRRIEKAGAAKAGLEVDLKLGPGGIREIEFFVSALQLIYGGREPGVRERGTMKALHRLALKGLITYGEQQELGRAYEFLRTAEHRVQLVEERQSHSYPDIPSEVRALALRMGYRDAGGQKAEDEYRAELARRVGKVREIYDGLLTFCAGEGGQASGVYDLMLQGEMGEEEARVALGGEGFRDPAQAYRNVLLLRDGQPGAALTPRSRQLFMGIMPALLGDCASSPDPDMALNNLESFISAFGSREALYALIHEKPESGALLTKLFGSSDYLSRLIVGRPEMFDLMLAPGEEGLERSPSAISEELCGLVANAGSFAEKMEALRRFKRAEEVRIGVRDILLDPGWRSVSADMTALAEAEVSCALKMAFDDTALRYGPPKGQGDGLGVAVVGLGKLGSGELGYGSDLDIVFVYKGAPARKGKGDISGPEFHARVAERLIFALSSLTRDGFAFRVDTRLRPGGSKGVLAHTVGGLDKYYSRQASVWELQALTRARCVAGDPDLCSSFEEMRLNTLLFARDPDTTRREVAAMRARLERELGGKTKGGLNIKHGRGGLVDIEFIAQYFQLILGRNSPELLVPLTVDALSALGPSGALVADDCEFLKESYDFFRELESRLRITTGQAGSALPEDGFRLNMLAARMGLGQTGGAGLVEEYKRRARVVREIFDRVFKPATFRGP